LSVAIASHFFVPINPVATGPSVAGDVMTAARASSRHLWVMNGIYWRAVKATMLDIHIQAGANGAVVDYKRGQLYEPDMTHILETFFGSHIKLKLDANPNYVPARQSPVASLVPYMPLPMWAMRQITNCDEPIRDGYLVEPDQSQLRLTRVLGNNYYNWNRSTFKHLFTEHIMRACSWNGMVGQTAIGHHGQMWYNIDGGPLVFAPYTLLPAFFQVADNVARINFKPISASELYYNLNFNVSDIGLERIVTDINELESNAWIGQAYLPSLETSTLYLENVTINKTRISVATTRVRNVLPPASYIVNSFRN